MTENDAIERTPEQCERDAAIGRDLANDILGCLNGISPGIAYNLIGNIAVSVFCAIPYVNPPDALTEFDAWAKYTRETIEAEIKRKMQ